MWAVQSHGETRVQDRCGCRCGCTWCSATGVSLQMAPTGRMDASHHPWSRSRYLRVSRRVRACVCALPPAPCQVRPLRAGAQPSGPAQTPGPQRGQGAWLRCRALPCPALGCRLQRTVHCTGAGAAGPGWRGRDGYSHMRHHLALRLSEYGSSCKSQAQAQAPT